jgi:hypothetical protein
MRKIWAVTREGVKADQHGTRIYSGNFELIFARPESVVVQINYGDTGGPAPKVFVGGANAESSSFTTTDAAGRATLRLPRGEYRLHMTPAIGTDYVATETKMAIDAGASSKVIQAKIEPAAVVNVVVRDADTGAPLENVDLWTAEAVPNPTREKPYYKSVHGYRSWEVETRISHYDRPRTGKDGKTRALFRPGTHRIGVGLESFPPRYKPANPEPKEIKCQAGKPVTVAFEMLKDR